MEELDLDSLLKIFIAETEENLGMMEQALLALEARPDDRELIDSLFRAIHTLKGNSASLGFPSLAEFAHTVEELLDRLRRGELVVDTPLVSLLLECVDAVQNVLPDLSPGSDVDIANQRPLTAAIRHLTSDAETRRHGDTVTESPRPRFSASPRRETAGRIRVDLGKLDRLVNLVGEASVAGSRLRQQIEVLAPSVRGEISESFDKVAALLSELQEAVMKSRMVPLGPTLHQQERTVRELATQHGKSARMIVEGGGVEVDVSIIEHLRDPLTHIIRNAVDHGIERPEVREAQGKEPQGKIVLRAFHDTGSIFLQISDDGAGIQRDRVRARARQDGLDVDHMTDEELIHQIFQPGFSTAETVTEISGRGVGMDVVKRNIEKIRGSLSIRSQEGQGTMLTIRLPLTLAIIPGLSVDVAGESYIIPLSSVSECGDLPAAASAETGAAGVMNFRGEAVSYLRLRDHFRIHGSRPKREQTVVVSHDGIRAGLVVDSVQGEIHTVIKPMVRPVREIPGVSGTAILPSGKIALILEVGAILREASRHNRTAARSAM